MVTSLQNFGNKVTNFFKKAKTNVLLPRPHQRDKEKNNESSVLATVKSSETSRQEIHPHQAEQQVKDKEAGHGNGTKRKGLVSEWLDQQRLLKSRSMISFRVNMLQNVSTHLKKAFQNIMVFAVLLEKMGNWKPLKCSC